MPLWFDGDCVQKVLIDNGDLSDSESLTVIMKKTLWLMLNNVTYAAPLMTQINFQKCMLQY